MWVDVEEREVVGGVLMWGGEEFFVFLVNDVGECVVCVGVEGEDFVVDCEVEVDDGSELLC